MGNGRVRQATSKRLTAWSEQTLPGWWTMFTIIAGAGFFLYLAYSLISPAPPPPAPRTAAAPTVTGSRTAPLETGPATTATPSASSAAPAETGEVPVARWDGTSQQVPRAALTLATGSFKALFDPAAAAAVPVAGGGHLPTPAQALPNATVSDVALASQGEPGRLFFSALVDYDGPAGPAAPAPVYRTIALIGGQWVAMNTTG